MVANVDKSLLYGELQVNIASVQIGQICLYSTRSPDNGLEHL